MKRPGEERALSMRNFTTDLPARRMRFDQRQLSADSNICHPEPAKPRVWVAVREGRSAAKDPLLERPSEATGKDVARSALECGGPAAAFKRERALQSAQHEQDTTLSSAERKCSDPHARTFKDDDRSILQSFGNARQIRQQDHELSMRSVHPLAPKEDNRWAAGVAQRKNCGEVGVRRDETSRLIRCAIKDRCVIGSRKTVLPNVYRVVTGFGQTQSQQ
jgi:hypothetical protein